jgi:SAM-dependent methyltransferase
MKTARVMQNGRLVYYREAADAAYWEHHWEHHFDANIYAAARTGDLGFAKWESIYTRYLPKTGKILEAGCGLGHVVLALRVRGYDVEGVEWAEQTVEKVNQWLPDVPIRKGDVTALDVPDGYYAGYISIGVIEHRQAGPEPFLKEAYRILQPGGVALISVPSLHPLRKLKGQLGLYRGKTDGLDFYQYAYSRETLGGFLQDAGFKVQAYESYDGFKGIKDELAPVRFLLRQRYIGVRLKTRLLQSNFIENRFGHMLMAVCQKV